MLILVGADGLGKARNLVRDSRNRRRLFPDTCEIPLRQLLPAFRYRRESAALFAELEAEPPMSQRRPHWAGKTRNHVEDHPLRIVC